MKSKATILSSFHETAIRQLRTHKNLYKLPFSLSLSLPLFSLFPSALLVVSMWNKSWFTKVHVHDNRYQFTPRRYQRLVNVTSACYSFRSIDPECVSPIDYIRLTPTRIIISVFVRVARLIIGKIRDLRLRFRRTLTTHTYAAMSVSFSFSLLHLSRTDTYNEFLESSQIIHESAFLRPYDYRCVLYKKTHY